MTVHSYPSSGSDYLSNYGSVGAKLIYKMKVDPNGLVRLKKMKLKM
ncbi:MAG: hypothetical protein IPG79_06555 [Saprospiraceae bacterium]|nr:hypothetical protein [Saprospiraceae bacterium]